jgi:hypothetical protein
LSTGDYPTGAGVSFNRVLSGLFLLAICGPLLRQLSHEEVAPERARAEFRKLAELPAWPSGTTALGEYAADFDAWYSDHFGFRGQLLRWHNGLKWLGLGTSPAQSMVQGRDGWMFTTDSRSIAMYRGAIPFTLRELEDWRWSLEARKESLARHGIEYVFAIGPSKWEIYPEQMPARFTRMGPSRLEQLTAHLKRHSSVRIVDLRPDLMEAKAADGPGDLTYYPLGTHWTERGAMAAYRRLGQELAECVPAYRGQSTTNFQLVATDNPGDSWARRLYLEDVLVQKSFKYRRRAPGVAVEVAAPGTPPRTLRTEQANSELPRAVLLHDSFAEQMRHWLAEDFSHFSAYWRYEFDAERIVAERPDVVIQIWVGRALEFMPPTFMLQESKGILGELFASSDRTLLNMREGLGAAQEDSGLWRLPPFSAAPGERVLVHLRIQAKRKGTLVFLEEDPLHPGHGRIRLGILRLESGLNDLHAILDAMAPGMRMLVGSPVPVAAGDLAVRGLELREMPSR